MRELLYPNRNDNKPFPISFIIHNSMIKAIKKTMKFSKSDNILTLNRKLVLPRSELMECMIFFLDFTTVIEFIIQKDYREQRRVYFIWKEILHQAVC